ncbi:hypothetical protein L1987_74154 [Smallanthus sonchifolius]|uniref:Uncharacterized protein n=1 Tax=Smallanthus sonchifolius TaxID=185202 RepID=A0ACB9A205_9ASTR|nr:hypothetical protein L1987_74154 [Smallanthus sonchifolius]
MGFGNIIKFNISYLPTSIGYWLVSNYDPSCNQLNLGTHVITITPQTVHEVLGIPMGKVQFGNLKIPTMKDAVIAEFRKQFDITYKPPTPIELFHHLKERYKRTNPGKNQIPAISFFLNDAMNKLSADDEEKEKEKGVETETVKGDRKRKGDDKEGKEEEKEIDVETETVKGDGKRKRGDKEEKEQDPSAIIINLGDDDIGQKMLSTSTSTIKNQRLKVKLRASKPEPGSKTTQVLPETQGQDKLEEFNQIDDYWQRRSYYESTAGSIEGLSANASKLAHPTTESGEKAGKTSSSKPSVQGAKASTGYVLPGLQTTGKDEKPTQVKKVNEDDTGKTAQDAEVKKEKQHKVKEVDAGEGKVDEQKVVGEDDDGKTAQVVGFETPAPKSKDHAEVPVNMKKVNVDDIGKTAQDGEVKREKQHKVKEVDAGEGKVDEQKVVGEDDIGKTAQVGGFETPAPKSKEDSEVPVNVKKVNEDDIGKTAQDGEVKKEKQHKVKEVDAGEGKMDKQKVVGEDDAGKTAQVGGFETPPPKSKEDSEVPVFIGVNLNKKNKEQKKNAARATRPTEALCSPYVQRVIQLNTKRENIDDRISE